MATVQEIRCDFCDTVLVGKKGIHDISKSYLEIAGFVRDWKAEPRSTWRNQTFISHIDQRPMAFCSNTSCFQDYIDMKVTSWKVQREQKLRDGATAEMFTRGNKGDY